MLMQSPTRDIVKTPMAARVDYAPRWVVRLGSYMLHWRLLAAVPLSSATGGKTVELAN